MTLFFLGDRHIPCIPRKIDPSLTPLTTGISGTVLSISWTTPSPALTSSRLSAVRGLRSWHRPIYIPPSSPCNSKGCAQQGFCCHVIQLNCHREIGKHSVEIESVRGDTWIVTENGLQYRQYPGANDSS